MRILAGAYKGRKLLPPPGRGTTRPVTARVKKSLFGVLGDRLDAATVLDLYCGTGTLGLEALSRGAARCCFADRDRAVLARLRRNIEAVGAGERCTIWHGDIPARLADWLAGLDRSVDVAFVDPPFGEARRWSWPAAIDRVFVPLARRLAHGGLVVLRLPGKVAPPERLGALAARRLRRYGGMAVAVFGLQEESE